jgi:hypothetical protein
MNKHIAKLIYTHIPIPGRRRIQQESTAESIECRNKVEMISNKVHGDKKREKVEPGRVAKLTGGRDDSTRASAACRQSYTAVSAASAKNASATELEGKTDRRWSGTDGAASNADRHLFSTLIVSRSW